MRKIVPGTETRPIICRLFDLQRKGLITPEEHEFLQAAVDHALTDQTGFIEYADAHALLGKMLNAEKDPCALCGRQTKVTMEEQKFGYGALANAVELTATVKVFTCDYCNEQFCNWEGEEAREEAVRKHLESDETP